MTHNKDDHDLKLDDAIRAVRDDVPDAKSMHAAATRVQQRIAAGAPEAVEQIRGCDDIRKLLPAYATGQLPPARALLVEAHVRECVACRHYQQTPTTYDRAAWSVPLPATAQARWWPAFALVAGVVVLGIAGLLVQQIYFAVPAGPRATIQSLDGGMYAISGDTERPLRAGDQLAQGEVVRTAAGTHAVLQLREGSLVEVNERSELAVSARGKDTTLTLDDGAVIVQAAKRNAGHLYVRTPDCRVAVTGTIFAVRSGLKGSRVSVIEGEVRVAHAGTDKVLRAGDQVSTSPALTTVAMREEIGWSRNRDKHLELMAQFVNLQRQFEQIATPGPRYSSDLLNRVPENTVVYASIPNLGEALSEANRIFQSQLRQSETLREWWTRGRADREDELNQAIEKIRLLSEYLGDEVVLVGVSQRDDPGVVMLANLRRTGLREFLDTQFAPKPGERAQFRTMDEHELSMATPAMVRRQMLALVRDDVVAFSPDLDALRTVNQQLNAGPGAFTATDFGKRIAEAYSRGAGLMIAANLQQITAEHERRMQARGIRRGPDKADAERAGFRDVKYLIAEHREINGVPDNRLVLDFVGQRRGIPSWLAAPGPMGSLEFVSRSAAMAVAFVTKSPTEMMNDLIRIDGGAHRHSESHARFKAQAQEMAAYFGGDAVIALDGPVLPTPSWKVIVQVYDPVRLQAAIEQMVQTINHEARSHGKPGLEMRHEDVNGQPFYVVRSLAPKVTGSETYYTFAAGYMLMAADRAILMNTLRTRTTGDSLARSADFLALLPRDEHANCSAVVYQNLSPVLEPLLSQLSGDRARAIQQLAADARPSAICAYGEQTRIEAVSNSKLFGLDFLALSALLEDLGTTRRQTP